TFRQGMVVLHTKFGLGKVVALGGSGGERAATIDFSTRARRKKIALAQGGVKPGKKGCPPSPRGRNADANFAEPRATIPPTHLQPKKRRVLDPPLEFAQGADLGCRVERHAEHDAQVARLCRSGAVQDLRAFKNHECVLRRVDFYVCTVIAAVLQCARGELTIG